MSAGMKPREPRVYRDPRSPHWVGVYYAWSEAAGKVVRVRKSTECTQKTKAQSVVDEWDRVAQAVAGGIAMSREKAMESINVILRLAGVPEVAETPAWDTYSKAWLKLHEKGDPKERETDQTHRNYQSFVRTFDAFLGKRVKWPLSKFDGTLLQQFYNGLLEEGRAPSTARNIIGCLGRIFGRARSEGYCQRNPLELVVRSSEDIERKREVFTMAEQTKIIAYLEKHKADPALRDWLTMTHLGAATGRRLQDCAQAGWQNFSEETVPGSKQKLLVWTLRPRKLRRKMKVERVPIVGPAAEYLRALRKEAEGLFLCPEIRGGGCHLSDAYIAILKAAGVKVSKIEALGEAGHDWQSKSFHSWRHTLTSRLAEAGVDERIGKRITGHESSQVHAGYTHLEVVTLAAELRRTL